ncbi:MAG: hypothetical protein ABIJ86_04740 [Spirochaetota bacterium]
MSIPDSETLAPVRSATLFLAGLGGLVVLLVVMIMALVTGYVLRPVVSLEGAIQEIATGVGRLADSISAQSAGMVQSSAVATMSDQSRIIRETNAIVASVAARTNLLAMNAAIEAAQAKQANRELRGIEESVLKVGASSTEAEMAFASVLELIEGVRNLAGEVSLDKAEQNEDSRQALSALSEINAETGVVKDMAAEMGRFKT